MENPKKVGALEQHGGKLEKGIHEIPASTPTVTLATKAKSPSPTGSKYRLDTWKNPITREYFKGLHNDKKVQLYEVSIKFHDDLEKTVEYWRTTGCGKFGGEIQKFEVFLEKAKRGELREWIPFLR